jgi:methionyl-tRNA synthetase
MKETISFEDFAKIDIRVGEIVSAERVPETDRLLKLAVKMGEENPRTIVSGIYEYFPDPEKLVGIKCAFVANLEPRAIKGIESEGMILAVHSEDNDFSLFEVSSNIPSGTSAK